MEPVFRGAPSQAVSFPRDENALVFSSLREFEQVQEGTALSIKYVSRGAETYRWEGQTHRVATGQYLVVNRGRPYEASFKHAQPVDGVCIYLNMNVVSDAHRAMSESDVKLLDEPRDSARDISFYEDVFCGEENGLGRRLRRLTRDRLHFSDVHDLPVEIFHDLAVDLVRSQMRIRREIAGIPAAKVSTRSELYRRVRTARSFIEAEFAGDIKISDIAEASALSETHLIRTFRGAFGRAPYQYVIDVRMRRAAEQLRDGSMTATKVAVDVGYPDLASFSKAFRKHYGVPPSEWVP